MDFETLEIKLDYLIATVRSLPYLFKKALFPSGAVRKKIKNRGKFRFYYRTNTVDEIQLLHSLSAYFIQDYDWKKNDLIIDVGAHIGTFAIPAADKVSAGRVYAIE